MEAGQSNKKIGFIIQARMASTRLPGKILMPLPFDSEISLLERITNSLASSKFNHSTVVATSLNKENDAIEAYC